MVCASPVVGSTQQHNSHGHGCSAIDYRANDQDHISLISDFDILCDGLDQQGRPRREALPEASPVLGEGIRGEAPAIFINYGTSLLYDVDYH